MTDAEPRITPSRIKTRQLQLLSQIERDGSALRAADALGISQSAASRMLSELERDIGVKLFSRHARGMVPTPSGEVLIRRAGAALSELARARQEVALLQRGGRVPLSIGSLLSPCSGYLPKALMALAQAEPDLLVSVHVDTSLALIDALVHARFDFVVARVRDASLEPELVFEPLVDETFVVIAGARHPLARRRRLKFGDLVAMPWVLPPAGTDLRARLDAVCVQHGLPPLRSVIETVSAPVILNVLRTSDALAVLPEEFVRPERANGSIAVLPVDLGVRTEMFGLITLRHREHSPQLQRALRVFRACAKASYPQR